MGGEPGPARRGDEGGQALQPLQRIQQECRGAVAPRTSELIEERPARALREPRPGQRRPPDIPAHLREWIPPVRRHRHVRGPAEAREPGSPPPRGRRVGRRPEATHRRPGARTQRDSALPRGGDGLREQWRLRRERVAPGGLVRPPPAPDQEPPDAPVQPREQPGDVGVGGRRPAVEHLERCPA